MGALLRWKIPCKKKRANCKPRCRGSQEACIGHTHSQAFIPASHVVFVLGKIRGSRPTSKSETKLANLGFSSELSHVRYSITYDIIYVFYVVVYNSADRYM